VRPVSAAETGSARESRPAERWSASEFLAAEFWPARSAAEFRLVAKLVAAVPAKAAVTTVTTARAELRLVGEPRPRSEPSARALGAALMLAAPLVAVLLVHLMPPISCSREARDSSKIYR
jgi:hypothetical protein